VNDISPDILPETFRRFWINSTSVSDAVRKNCEKFVPVIDKFYELRFAARERFETSRHLADKIDGALPLDWEKIEEIVVGHGNGEVPPKRLVVRIAKDCSRELENIVREPKRVLRRERQETELSKIQQIDSTCMRNWAHRTGGTLEEKAGEKQTLLAVVRRENYDILENRIVRDFSERTGTLASRYLKEFGKRDYNNKTESEKILNSVKRLKALCGKILELSEFKSVKKPPSPISPNYTLRENANYSRIWKFYREILTEATFAENLWKGRKIAEKTLNKDLMNGTETHLPRDEKKFRSEIWFNPQLGATQADNLLENPNWKNVPAQTEISYPKIEIYNSTAIFDLESLPWQTLVKSRLHANAKKYLHESWHPNNEDFNADENKFFAGTEPWQLKDILRNLNAGKDEQASQLLREFFEQLNAKLKEKGAEKWLILVPDTWNAEFLEKILSATPDRENVHLLWRSVATALGSDKNARKENEEIPIPYSVDFFDSRDCKYCSEWTKRETDGVLIPWRHRLRKGNSKREEYSNVETRAVAGAKEFLAARERGEVAYYDELEAMYLVYQKIDTETVELKEIVHPEPKFHGGMPHKIKEFDTGLKVQLGAKSLKFFLLWTNETDEDLRRTEELKVWETQEIEQGALEVGFVIKFSGKITPGQGLAQLRAAYAKDKNVALDYSKMEDSGETANSLDAKLDRSFPPVSPRVLCNPALWKGVKKAYEKGEDARPNGNAKATDIFSMSPPDEFSPVEKLRRMNVFGNADDESVPESYRSGRVKDVAGNSLSFTPRFPDDQSECEKWFKQMAEDYKKAEDNKNDDERKRLLVWIAWTYETGKIFRDVKATCYKNVLNSLKLGTAVLPQEITVCSNLFTEKDEGQRKAIRKIVCDVRDSEFSLGSRLESLRLFYNILMFHDNALADLNKPEDVKKFADFAQRLAEFLVIVSKEQRSGEKTKRFGYILKCLLYLLRLRNFVRGKNFLSSEEDKKPIEDELSKVLLGSVPAKYKDLFENYKKYLGGKGTLDGLPTN